MPIHNDRLAKLFETHKANENVRASVRDALLQQGILNASQMKLPKSNNAEPQKKSKKIATELPRILVSRGKRVI